MLCNWGMRNGKECLTPRGRHPDPPGSEAEASFLLLSIVSASPHLPASTPGLPQLLTAQGSKQQDREPCHLSPKRVTEGQVTRATQHFKARETFEVTQPHQLKNVTIRPKGLCDLPTNMTPWPQSWDCDRCPETSSSDTKAISTLMGRLQYSSGTGPLDLASDRPDLGPRHPADGRTSDAC